MVSGGTRLEGFLHRHHRIGLDTCLFIYQVEANARYLPWVNTIFAWVEEPRHSAVTSTVTLLELLVQPYRKGDIDRADQIYALFSTYPHLEWIVPTLEIADHAARLRAEHNLRTPDALQVATAAASQATALITNDNAFERVAGLDVLILDQLLSADGNC